MSRRILIVSDGVLTAATWSVLSERGFDPIVVENADHAYERLTSAQFDLMVIGLEQPIEGADIIKWIRAHKDLRQVSILAIAEWGTGGAMMALAQGADAVETAPIDGQRFMAAVERLLPKIVMTAKAAGPNRHAQE
jgi:DNA-binding response OmpR family regulator